jgi:hypothetical protein
MLWSKKWLLGNFLKKSNWLPPLERAVVKLGELPGTLTASASHKGISSQVYYFGP